MQIYKRGYKPKTIKKVINKKLDEWIESIDDKSLREVLYKNTLVTGGSIASMVLGEPVNDFDIYFKNKETVIKVAEYYINKIRNNTSYQVALDRKIITNIRGIDEEVISIMVPSAGSLTLIESENDAENVFDNEDHEYQETDEIAQDLENKQKYQVAFVSPNAITLTDKIQLVLRFYGEPEQIHKNFDFVHAQGVFDLFTQKLTIPNEALLAMTSRTLIYTGSLYPIASLFRSKKFLSRGWGISAGEYLKIAFQISKLDLKNLQVLKEQLTGVDMTYLKMVYYALEQAFKSNPSLDIDSQYVVEVIDKIFNS